MESDRKEQTHLGSRRLLILILFVLAFLVFAPSLHYDFLNSWDDPEYIVDNEHIRGFAHENIKGIFSSYYQGNYAPVHILSYGLDYLIWGGASPLGFRITNYALHALNAVLLFLLFPHLGIRKGWAFLISLVFAVHPVQVESVVWLSERKNVLSLTFFLLSFLFYIRYRGLERPRDYLFSLLTFILSLFTKAVVVVGPLIFALYELCFLREKKISAIMRRQLPFVLGSLVLSVITYHSQDSSIVEFWGGGPLGTLYTMMGVFVRYLYLCFFPFHLSAIYDPPIHFSAMDWRVLVSFLLLSVMVAWMLWDYFKGERRYAFFIAWFFIFLVPVSQIIPINILMADRYLYFPIIGWAAVLGLVARKAMGMRGSALLKKGLPLFLGIVVACYSLITTERERVWQDSSSLFRDAVRKVPEQGRAYYSFAGYYVKIEDFAKAAETYWTAIQKIRNAYRGYEETGKGYSPRTMYDLHVISNSFINMGNAYFQLKDYDRALRSFESAVKTREDFFPDGHVGLGDTYLAMGRDAEGLKEYQMVMDQLEQWEFNENTLEIYNHMGLFLAKFGKPQEGLTYYHKVVELDPGNFEARKGLGSANGLLGRYDNALQAYQKALEIKPEDKDLLYNMGVTYMNLERFEEAVKYFMKSRETDIQRIRTLSHLNLGIIFYEHLHDKKGALYHLKKTLELDPQNDQKEDIIEAINELEKS